MDSKQELKAELALVKEQLIEISNLKSMFEERTLRAESENVTLNQEVIKTKAALASIQDEKTSVDRKIILGENYKKKLEEDVKQLKADNKQAEEDKKLKDEEIKKTKTDLEALELIK